MKEHQEIHDRTNEGCSQMNDLCDALACSYHLDGWSDAGPYHKLYTPLILLFFFHLLLSYAVNLLFVLLLVLHNPFYSY